MYIVKKVLSPDKGYSCCFRQRLATSHCNVMHGYDLRFTLTFGCNDNQLQPGTGWVIGFGDLEHVKDFLNQHFDHTMLVAQDDPLLGLFQTLDREEGCRLISLPRVGCEAFAKFVYDEVNKQLPYFTANGVQLLSVEVAENGANSATYAGGDL